MCYILCYFVSYLASFYLKVDNKCIIDSQNSNAYVAMY